MNNFQRMPCHPTESLDSYPPPSPQLASQYILVGAVVNCPGCIPDVAEYFQSGIHQPALHQGTHIVTGLMIRNCAGALW